MSALNWWSIHYGNGRVVWGRTEKSWLRAPKRGVQAVALHDGAGNSTCREDGSAITDRSLWTGTDEYDPFGWGPKRGALIEDDAYWAIWAEACDGHR